MGKNSLKKFHNNSEIDNIKACEKCGGVCDERQKISVTVGGHDCEYYLCMEHSVELMCIMGKVLEEYLPVREERVVH